MNGTFYTFAVPLMSIFIKYCPFIQVPESHQLGSPAGFLKCSEPEQSDSNGLANGELTFPSVISRNPNGEGLVHWPQYDQEEKYLGIDLEQKAAEKLKEHRVDFWAQLMKQSQTGRRKHTDL